MHGTTLLFFLLVSIFCADVLAKHAHPARPRAAERHYSKRDHFKRNRHSFDNPLIAKRQVKAGDIRSGKKKRDCPVPLVSGVCNCPSGTFCNNECVDTTSDTANCGACSFDCTTDYATGSECMASVCECIDPDINCGGACVNPQTDPNNCNECGVSCNEIIGAGAVCLFGSCTCISPESPCPGLCTNIQEDYNNCGGCGISCGTVGLNEQCLGGMCGCAQPYPDTCPFGCTDLQNDVDNCGDCGNSCGPDALCGAGSCICIDGADILCPKGVGCIDPVTDPNNCGGCGNVCGDAATCQSGSCICDDPSLNDCNGSCVDFNTDDNNCGSCGYACGPEMFCDIGICELF